jgi:hypothetical protein
MEIGTGSVTVNASYDFMEINSFLINITDLCFNTSTCTFVDENISFTALNTSYLFDSVGEKHWIRTWTNETIAENLTIYVNPYQYFYFFDNIRSLVMNNYTFGNYDSSGGYVKIPFYDLGSGTHDLIFEKVGYENNTYEFIFDSHEELNQTFNVTPISFVLSIFAEDSPATQLYFNLTIINSTNSTQYLNQYNFQKYANETLGDDLTLIISSSLFSTRKLYTRLQPYTTTEHVIYLLKREDTTPVIFRALNSAGTTPLEDVVINFYKNLNGVRTFIGQAKTDSQGYTFFNMDELGDYEIVFSKIGYVLTTINSIPGRTEYPILMDESSSLTTWLFQGFSFKFLPNSAQVTSPFNASVNIVDELNLLSKIEFSVSGDNIYNKTISTNSNGGLFTIEINQNSSWYEYNLTIIREGQSYTFIKKYNENNILNVSSSTDNLGENIDEENGFTRGLLIITSYLIVVGGVASLFGSVAGATSGIFVFAIAVNFGWMGVGFATVLGAFTLMGGLYLQK